MSYYKEKPIQKNVDTEKVVGRDLLIHGERRRRIFLYIDSMYYSLEPQNPNFKPIDVLAQHVVLQVLATPQLFFKWASINIRPTFYCFYGG